MTNNWVKLFEFDTTYCADSVEWCPIKDHEFFFTCGTYSLLKDDDTGIQKRIGAINLFKLTNKELELKSQIETWGILDMKWSNYPCDGKILLACADSIGEVMIFELLNECLNLITKINLKTSEEGDYMVLSLNWFERKDGDGSRKICASDNKGNIAILSYNTGCLTLDQKWRSHSLEAWTVAFDKSNCDILYSGGDDARLCIWDKRNSTTTPTKVLKHQGTGVTIIHTNTNSEHEILCGSFDEALLVYDKRQWKSPVHTVRCSGGLWRVKCKQEFILTANIYGGFEIFHNSQSPQLIAQYKEHSSLAYGADWSYINSNEVKNLFPSFSSSSSLLATCSFYDHKMTVSLFDPEKTAN